MAQAKTKAGMLRVKFVGMPGPPARLEAGEVVIEAGRVGELPEALARELAVNPAVGLELTDEAVTPPSESESETPVEENANGPVLQHVNPEPAEQPDTKE